MRLITVRGIGEPLEGNMLDHFAREFPHWERHELAWDATYGPVGGKLTGDSFNFAVQMAGIELIATIGASSEPCVLVGYSAGAEIVGNYVYRVGQPQVKAAVLVADPSAARNEYLGRSGIRGARNGTPHCPTLRIVNADDPICSCPEDSPLRAIAEATPAFSLGDPAAFTFDMARKLQPSNWRNWWRWLGGDPTKYRLAYEQACGYMGVNPVDPTRVARNSHTDYADGIREAVKQVKQMKGLFE